MAKGSQSSTLTVKISDPVAMDIVTVAFTSKLLRLVAMLPEDFWSD